LSDRPVKNSGKRGEAPREGVAGLGGVRGGKTTNHKTSGKRKKEERKGGRNPWGKEGGGERKLKWD